jgi:hypothetical protein
VLYLIPICVQNKRFGLIACKNYGAWAAKIHRKRGALMVATGEFIRAMNYVDDITATLRRLGLYIPSMNADERKRLAEALRGAGSSLNASVAELEKT